MTKNGERREIPINATLQETKEKKKVGPTKGRGESIFLTFSMTSGPAANMGMYRNHSAPH